MPGQSRTVLRCLDIFDQLMVVVAVSAAKARERMEQADKVLQDRAAELLSAQQHERDLLDRQRKLSKTGVDPDAFGF